MVQRLAIGSHAQGIEICLLGTFRVVKDGVRVAFRNGGKAELLLGTLAVRAPRAVSREEIVVTLWPDSEMDLARQSLNTLVYSLTKKLGTGRLGRPPLEVQGGDYRLDDSAGVSIDITAFDRAVETGDRLSRAGDRPSAMVSYRDALRLYGGDLAVGTDVRLLVERERLRSRYLSAMAHLADHHLAAAEYERALDCALGLLAHDPCREDAHRMAMRCFVHLEQRAQALRQYGICRQVLAREFGVSPERATQQLYELVRTDPAGV
jgi:DNA-binding SARP family transcriptional activator